MEIYRVSVTVLEGFWHYLDCGDIECVSEYIEGLFIRNRSVSVRLGLSAHRYLSGEDRGLWYGDGYIGVGDGYMGLIDYRVEVLLEMDRIYRDLLNFLGVGGCIWELGLSKVYNVGGIYVEVVGRLDGFMGSLLELKTTLGSFDYSRYSRSLQWRLYCDIIGIARCYYIVYELKGLGDRDRGIELLRGYHCFDFVYSRDIDIVNILFYFIEFIKAWGIEGRFKVKD